jgi:hypothetical protein
VVDATAGLSGELGPVGRNIWESTADSVIDTCRSREVYLQFRIVWVSQVCPMEICLDVTALVSGSLEIVGESTGRREVVGIAAEMIGHDDFGIVNGAVDTDLASSDRQNVGAAGGVLRIEDGLFGAHAAGLDSQITGEGSNTVISRGEEDGMALETELHELVTLTLGIWGWQVCLGFSIGCSDDLGGCVDSALASAGVAARDIVGVHGVVLRVVPSLAIGGVVAV